MDPLNPITINNLVRHELDGVFQRWSFSEIANPNSSATLGVDTPDLEDAGVARQIKALVKDGQFTTENVLQADLDLQRKRREWDDAEAAVENEDLSNVKARRSKDDVLLVVLTHLLKKTNTTLQDALAETPVQGDRRKFETAVKARIRKKQRDRGEE